MLRVGLGGLFIYLYGWEKLAGGIDTWRNVGKAMSHLGVHFWYPFWGFLATMVESIGMLLFVIGFAFRPACLLITFNLIVAAVVSYHGDAKTGSGLHAAGHPLELAIVFFAMTFIGPGKYSVDRQ